MAVLSRAPAWAALLALGAGGGCGGDSGGTGGGEGAAGPSGPVTSGSGQTVAGVTVTTQASMASTGVGGSAYACDPPAPPGSLYELYAESLDPNKLDPISMCEYRGDVTLIVNTAAL